MDKIKKKSKKYYERNKEKLKQRVSQWRKNNPRKYKTIIRNSTIKRTGISISEYNRMIKKQNEMCVGCLTDIKNLTNSLCVDHDHKCCSGRSSCGKCVRGLLCQKCNTILGLAKDDPEILMLLIKYINSGDR